MPSAPTPAAPPPATPPDSEHRGLVALLPAALRPYALLARFDRPIGSWLLFWPCAWAVALAGGLPRDIYLLLLFGIGATAMRGAGCVYNDIVDRDLDAKVERTRSRPLPSGQVRPKAAWNWLFALCMIGLIVLVQLQPIAQAVAVGSIAPVAAYPFMKRITWWPQAWLGIVFSWGALVGWPAVTGTLPVPALLLYAGCIAWVIGYDTLYALQDIEDDALAGIKSSARRMGARVRVGVALFYAAALLLWAGAFLIRRPDPVALLGLLPIAAHLAWQVTTLDQQEAANALARFRSNRFAGLLMLLGCWAVGSAG